MVNIMCFRGNKTKFLLQFARIPHQQSHLTKILYGCHTVLVARVDLKWEMWLELFGYINEWYRMRVHSHCVCCLIVLCSRTCASAPLSTRLCTCSRPCSRSLFSTRAIYIELCVSCLPCLPVCARCFPFPLRPPPPNATTDSHPLFSPRDVLHKFADDIFCTPYHFMYISHCGPLFVPEIESHPRPIASLSSV